MVESFFLNLILLLKSQVVIRGSRQSLVCAPEEDKHIGDFSPFTSCKLQMDEFSQFTSWTLHLWNLCHHI